MNKKSTCYSGMMAISLAVLLLVNSSHVSAINITGTWNMSVETDAGTGSPVFVFKQESDTTFTGTYSGMLGEASVQGTLKVGQIHFQFSIDGNLIEYTGTVEGNTMKGTVKLSTYGEGTFTGIKQVNITGIDGTWYVENTIDGSIYPLTLNLKQVNDTLFSGGFSGGYGQNEVNGKIKNGQISFYFFYEGYKVENKGTVNGNEMKGKVIVTGYGEGTFSGVKNTENK